MNKKLATVMAATMAVGSITTGVGREINQKTNFLA